MQKFSYPIGEMILHDYLRLFHDMAISLSLIIASNKIHNYPLCAEQASTTESSIAANSLIKENLFIFKKSVLFTFNLLLSIFQSY